MGERTPREQHLRNEVGQLTHKMHRMIDQRREMQADLVRQRDDMRAAMTALEAGSIREAMEILQSGLDYRDRTRPQRKVA